MKPKQFCAELSISPHTLRTMAFRNELPFQDPKGEGTQRAFTVGHLCKMRQMRELMAFGISAKVASGIIRDGESGAATLVLRLLEPHA